MNWSRPLPWRIKHVGFVLHVRDAHNCEVCMVDSRVYPDEAAARFAAETIVRAAAALSAAVDLVNNIGICHFCTLNNNDPVFHEDSCPLHEAP